MTPVKIYIYPTFNPIRDTGGNDYIKFFHDSFRNKDGVILENKKWNLGIVSILFNLDADIFIVQWVDKIPFKRLGKIQTIVYFLSMGVLHLLNKKIVWILHNKRAHLRESKLVDAIMDIIAKYSDCVITHSNDGVSFFKEKYPFYDTNKCQYIPHPVYSSIIYEEQEILWDYIIWGTIDRRKKIAEFLKAVKHDSSFLKKRILICGNCKDVEYRKEIEENSTPNVTFICKFLSEDELRLYVSRSKIVLFTYNTESVLSSGALIYSLNFCKPIIGPNAGNFKDLPGIVYCYDSYEDIFKLEINCIDKKLVTQFLNSNKWEEFPDKILKKYE